MWEICLIDDTWYEDDDESWVTSEQEIKELAKEPDSDLYKSDNEDKTDIQHLIRSNHQYKTPALDNQDLP